MIKRIALAYIVCVSVCVVTLLFLSSRIMATAVFRKGEAASINLPAYSLEPNSPASVYIYTQTKLHLADFTTKEDGSLNGTVTIPLSVDAGFYSMQIEGNSYSGEPISLNDSIEVQGADAGDIDGDGVPDSKEPCLYVPASGVDADNDGIDDACDPEISAKSASSPDPTHSQRQEASQNTTKTSGKSSQNSRKGSVSFAFIIAGAVSVLLAATTYPVIRYIVRKRKLTR